MIRFVKANINIYLKKDIHQNRTTEIFKIKNIRNTNPNTYILDDYRGSEIKGGFYEFELLKTKYTQTYLVEKVLKRRGNMLYVKWLGFSSNHNSWINLNNTSASSSTSL